MDKVLKPDHPAWANNPDDEDDDDEQMANEDQQRLLGVERGLQTTREQMIAGFGEVKEAIARTETSVAKEIGGVKESIAIESGAAKAETAKEIGAARESANKTTWVAMGLVVASVTIAVAVLGLIIRSGGSG